MRGNYCWAICQLWDEWTIEEAVYTEWQKDAKVVPNWVWADWTENEDGTWTDNNNCVWDKDGYTTPNCPTPRTPGYEGEWPPVRPSEQDTEIPEEQAE